jgi:hypothetical protein
MTIISRRGSSSLILVAAALLVTVTGCDDTPTTAVVENGFPAPTDDDRRRVPRCGWRLTPRSDWLFYRWRDGGYGFGPRRSSGRRPLERPPMQRSTASS